MSLREILEGNAESIISDKEFNGEMERLTDEILKEEEGSGGYQTRIIAIVKSLVEDESEDELGRELMILDGMPDVDKGRHKVIEATGYKMAKEHWYKDGLANAPVQPVALLLASEAWMLDHQFEEGKTKVSDHNDKKEVIIVSGMTVDQRMNMALIEIKRDKNGNMKLRLDKYAPFAKGSSFSHSAQSALLSSFYLGIQKYIKEQIEEHGLSAILEEIK